MKQIFVSDPLCAGLQIELDEAAAHHLFDVTRTTPKEAIRVIGANGVFLAHVLEKPVVVIDAKVQQEQAECAPVVLCAAMVKADRFEWMIQKAVELGADVIVPLETRHTIIRLDEKRAAKKRERWQSIADAAARQCNRTTLARVETVCPLEQIERWKSEKNICAYEKEAHSRHLCGELTGYAGAVTYVIGPEGGLSGQEADFLQSQGFALCSLGEDILRAETAACYALSCTQFARAQTRSLNEDV